MSQSEFNIRVLTHHVISFKPLHLNINKNIVQHIVRLFYSIDPTLALPVKINKIPVLYI